MNEYKSIIYTYTNFSQEIKISQIRNRNFGNIFNRNIKYILASSIYSEKKLESSLNDFYNNSSLSVLVIKFRIIDFIHLNHIQECIENFGKDQGDVEKRKIIIILIHLYRKLKGEEWTEEEEISKNPDTKYMISRICNYNQIFIDDLNGTVECKNIITCNNKQLYENKG